MKHNKYYYKNKKDYNAWKFSQKISLAFENCLALPVVYGSKIVMPILNAVLPKSYKSSPLFQDAMMEFYILTGNVKEIEKNLQTTWLNMSDKQRHQLLHMCLTHYARVFTETEEPMYSIMNYFKTFGVWPTSKNRQNLLPRIEGVLSLLANTPSDQSVWVPDRNGDDMFSPLNWKIQYLCIERILNVLHTPSIKTPADICYLLTNQDYVTLDENWNPQWSAKRQNLLHRASKMCVDNPQIDQALHRSDLLEMLVTVSDDKTCEILLSKSLYDQKKMDTFYRGFPNRSLYSPELFERVMKTCTKSNIMSLRKRMGVSKRYKDAFEQYDILQQKQRLQKAVDANTECTKEQSLSVDKSLIVEPPVRKRKM